MRAYFLRHIAYPQEGHEFPLIDVGEFDVQTKRMTRTFEIRWHEMPDGPPAPAIEVFHDAWNMFTEYSTLFGAFATFPTSTSADVDHVAFILTQCGFVNQTSALLIQQGMKPRGTEPGPN